MTITAKDIEREIAMRALNPDEAAQPSELVELTSDELKALIRQHGPAHVDPEDDYQLSSVGFTFMGLMVRIVDRPGPLRVKSRAEVMMESRRPPGPPVLISTMGYHHDSRTKSWWFTAATAAEAQLARAKHFKTLGGQHDAILGFDEFSEQWMMPPKSSM